MPRAKLNAYTADQLTYKLDIVQQEPELLESYATTIDAVNALIDRIKPNAEFEFSEEEGRMIAGELANSYDILEDQMGDAIADYKLHEWKRWMRQLKAACYKFRYWADKDDIR